jgi:3-dehydroquinate synthetase
VAKDKEKGVTIVIKKVQAGQLRWALPRTIGQAEIVRNVPIATVESVLSTLIVEG